MMSQLDVSLINCWNYVITKKLARSYPYVHVLHGWCSFVVHMIDGGQGLVEHPYVALLLARGTLVLVIAFLMRYKHWNVL